jgi:hypothetical protein
MQRTRATRLLAVVHYNIGIAVNLTCAMPRHIKFSRYTVLRGECRLRSKASALKLVIQKIKTNSATSS